MGVVGELGRLLPVVTGRKRPRLCKNAASGGNQLPGDFLSVQEAVGGPIRRNR
ncbi:hypothetical protein D9M68_853200 [compost metagenome]